MNAIKKFMQDEEGAVAIEYALLAGLIAVIIIFGASALGKSICGMFNGLAHGLSTTPFAAANFAPLATGC